MEGRKKKMQRKEEKDKTVFKFCIPSFSFFIRWGSYIVYYDPDNACLNMGGRGEAWTGRRERRGGREGGVRGNSERRPGIKRDVGRRGERESLGKGERRGREKADEKKEKREVLREEGGRVV